MAKKLKGYSVIVTRPEDQAESLCAAIEAEGGRAIRAPMIAINPVSDPKRCGKVLARINDYNSVIFISRNAVEFGIERLQHHKRKLSGQTIYAVGVGTAASLQEAGYGEVATPSGEFTSEGLLQLDGLQASEIRDHNILIFRGAGGREHLAETLKSRGALVDYCEVYERVVPTTSISEALASTGVDAPDITIITSLEGLTNYADKIDEEGLEKLFDLPLLVIGSRIAQEVEKLGFTNPAIIVDNPREQSIIDTLIKWVMDEI